MAENGDYESDWQKRLMTVQSRDPQIPAMVFFPESLRLISKLCGKFQFDAELEFMTFVTFERFMERRLGAIKEVDAETARVLQKECPVMILVTLQLCERAEKTSGSLSFEKITQLLEQLGVCLAKSELIQKQCDLLKALDFQLPQPKAFYVVHLLSQKICNSPSDAEAFLDTSIKVLRSFYLNKTAVYGPVLKHSDSHRMNQMINDEVLQAAIVAALVVELRQLPDQLVELISDETLHDAAEIRFLCHCLKVAIKADIISFIKL